MSGLWKMQAKAIVILRTTKGVIGRIKGVRVMNPCNVQ